MKPTAGKSLREWRASRQLTQEQLEARCAETTTAKERHVQLTQTTISALEVGKVINPKWDTVRVLAEALDIDPRWLRFHSEPEKQTRLPLKRKAS